MGATFDKAESGDVTCVHLSEKISWRDAPGLYSELEQLSKRRHSNHVALDFGPVASLDSAAVVAIRTGCKLIERQGKTCELRHFSEKHQQAFDLVPDSVDDASESEAQSPVLERLGERGYRFGSSLYELSEIVVDTTSSVASGLFGKGRLRIGSIIDHAVLFGVNAVFIVGLLGFLIGLILAFQAAHQLREFGADIFMAEVVSLGMVREFGAIMTAIIMAGRTGAAIAAELGTMTVREEVDALRTIGISPAGFLVAPRIIAITIVQPVLTLMSIAVGMAAGISVGYIVDLPVLAIYHRMQQSLTLADFGLGLGKSVLFAWIIGFVGSFMGLRTRGGAHSVGRQTTRAVVTSIFLIVVVDSLVTTVWTLSHD